MCSVFENFPGVIGVNACPESSRSLLPHEGAGNIVDHIEVASVSSLYQRLLRSALRVNLRVNKLADASLEDLCMLVLSLFLLFTTLLLPWVLL
jgi:hypothetical protein